MSKVKQIVVVEDESAPAGYVEYSLVDLDMYEGSFGEKALSHLFLMDSFRKLMGRTLTLVDSSITDKQQNKAMKDILRGIFSDEMEFAAQLAFDQKKITVAASKAYEKNEMEGTVEIEEVLGVK